MYGIIILALNGLATLASLSTGVQAFGTANTFGMFGAGQLAVLVACALSVAAWHSYKTFVSQRFRGDIYRSPLTWLAFAFAAFGAVTVCILLHGAALSVATLVLTVLTVLGFALRVAF